MIRRFFVWLHRWTGLLMAAFLIFEGLSGSMLAFYDNLERVITPQFYATPQPGMPPLDLAQLAESAAALIPQGQVSSVFLGTDRAIVFYDERENPATGQPYPLGFTQLFLDPWTGKELGRRNVGEISEGIVNLMPFIYQLHRNLALHKKGALLLGIVALCWTIDCFVGFYLTLPVSIGNFWRRWRPSWLVKWKSSPFRVNFDLHRASGLWLWPLLLIFAWSSVLLNLPSVYKSVMHSVLDYTPPKVMPREPRYPVKNAKPDWRAALSTGEKLMAEQAASRAFSVVRPIGLFYYQQSGTYTYWVQSSRDLSGKYHPKTFLTFDGDTGAFLSLSLPDLERRGDRFDAWLFALHRADVLGTPYRWLVCLIGLVIAMLSVTGIYIWWKKRKARIRAVSQRGPSAGRRLTLDAIRQGSLGEQPPGTSRASST